MGKSLMEGPNVPYLENGGGRVKEIQRIPMIPNLLPEAHSYSITKPDSFATIMIPLAIKITGSSHA